MSRFRAVRVSVNRSAVSRRTYDAHQVGSATKVRFLESEPRRCILQLSAEETVFQGHRQYIFGGLFCCLGLLFLGSIFFTSVDAIALILGLSLYAVLVAPALVPFYRAVRGRRSNSRP